jgi:hypothetical protein
LMIDYFPELSVNSGAKVEYPASMIERHVRARRQ